MRRGVMVLLLVTAGACGPGSWDFVDTRPGQPGDPAPDVVLLFVSGHTGNYDGVPSLTYLDDNIGPALERDLCATGRTVYVDYYVDHPHDTDQAGYLGLLTDLVWIRDHWCQGPPPHPRIAVVAHSHGGVWASAAIREMQELTIDVQVALDHGSYGWWTTQHTVHHDYIRGDPRNAYEIWARSSCTPLPRDERYAGPKYDLEDVVFPNVVNYLEVRSGEPVWWLDDEYYDETWNVRLDGSTDGVVCYVSRDGHEGMLNPGRGTYARVRSFITHHLDQRDAFPAHATREALAGR